MPHGGTDQLMHLLRIGKPDLSFGRMHVDVDPLRLDIEKKHKERNMALGEEGTVSIDNGMLHSAILDRSTIDE